MMSALPRVSRWDHVGPIALARGRALVALARRCGRRHLRASRCGQPTCALPRSPCRQGPRPSFISFNRKYTYNRGSPRRPGLDRLRPRSGYGNLPRPHLRTPRSHGHQPLPRPLRLNEEPSKITSIRPGYHPRRRGTDASRFRSHGVCWKEGFTFGEIRARCYPHGLRAGEPIRNVSATAKQVRCVGAVHARQASFPRNPCCIADRSRGRS
jgi:hypothetical protein